MTFYVNWFFVTLVAQDRPRGRPRARGSSSTSRWMTSRTSTRPCSRKGLKPDGEPERQPSGNREFVLRDPDCYDLVFFRKK